MILSWLVNIFRFLLTLQLLILSLMSISLQYRYHSDVYIFLKDVIQEMTTSFIVKVCFFLWFCYSCCCYSMLLLLLFALWMQHPLKNLRIANSRGE